MKIIHFESIDSTNTYLLKNYKIHLDLTFVSSDFQTNGKGRMQRIWASNKKENLLFSFLIKQNDLISKYNQLSILIAFTIIEHLKTYNISNLSIKWPNDVYYNDLKISGILLQSITVDNKIKAIVCGVGINVNQKLFDKDFKATSISNILNKNIDIYEFKKNLYKLIIKNLNLLKNNYDFYHCINKYNYLKNKNVIGIINNLEKEVVCLDFNSDYSLKVFDGVNFYDLSSNEITFKKV